jgi:hypothetical protein
MVWKRSPRLGFMVAFSFTFLLYCSKTRGLMVEMAGGGVDETGVVAGHGEDSSCGE